MEDPNVYAEVAAAGGFSAVHRYTCEGDGNCTLLLDACHTAGATGCKVASVNATRDPIYLPAIDGGAWRSFFNVSLLMAGPLSGV